MLTEFVRACFPTRTALTLCAGFIAATFVTGCSNVKPLRELIYPNSGAKADGTFYIGATGVALRPAPQRSSSPIATLALHQKVRRSKVEKGFAYVSVVGSGQTGWVDNAKLIWKLPAGSAPATRPTATDSEAAAAATSREPAQPADPSSDGDATGEESAMTSAPTESGPADNQPAEPVAETKPTDTDAAKPRGDADPTLFNPF